MLAGQFEDSEFSQNYTVQTSVGLGVKQSVTVTLTEPMGMERFDSIPRIFYQKANQVVILFDGANKQSLKNVKKWVDQTLDNSSNLLQTIWILGLKKMHEKQDLISKEELDMFYKSLDPEKILEERKIAICGDISYIYSDLTSNDVVTESYLEPKSRSQYYKAWLDAVLLFSRFIDFE